MLHRGAALAWLVLHGGLPAECRVHPAPQSCEEFSKIMEHESGRNETLLAYAYPANPVRDAQLNWVPYHGACRIANDCYCFHVRGDMSRARNPEGWKAGALRSRISSVGGRWRTKECACFSQRTGGDPCLFSDMR